MAAPAGLVTRGGYPERLIAMLLQPFFKGLLDDLRQLPVLFHCYMAQPLVQFDGDAGVQLPFYGLRRTLRGHLHSPSPSIILLAG